MSKLQMKLDSVKYTDSLAKVIPQAQLELFLLHINSLINDFNQSKVLIKKIEILNTIQAALDTFNDTWDPDVLAKYVPYITWHNNLQSELVRKKRELRGYSYATTSPSQFLQTLFAQIPPESLNQFMLEILQDYKNENSRKKNLKRLYPKNNNKPETVLLRQFLREYHIALIHKGNASNYKLTHKKTGQNWLLKINHGLTNSKTGENKAKQKPALERYFTANLVRRNAFIYSSRTQGYKYVTLTLTDFHPHGSLYQVAKHQKSIRSNKILKTDYNVFTQMTNCFIKLNQEGLFFPDGKIENWILTQKGRIKISDSKSIQFHNGKGIYSPGFNENTGFIYTRVYYPPEFSNNTFDVDKAHAYLLGLNMYNYLVSGYETSTWFKMLKTDLQKVLGKMNKCFVSDTTDDFNKPVFKTAEGREFQHIIKALTQKNPEDRPSVYQAQEMIHSVQPFLHQVQQLNKFCFGSQDVYLNQYLKIQANVFHASYDKGVRLQIIQQMAQLNKQFAENQHLQTIIQAIAINKKKASFFSSGKTNQLNKMMTCLTLEERLAINPQDPKYNEIYTLLKSRDSGILKHNIGRADKGA